MLVSSNGVTPMSKRRTRTQFRNELVEGILDTDARIGDIEELQAQHTAKPLSLAEMKQKLLEMM